MRRPLRRAEVLPFFAKLAPSFVGMEVCATAHHWERELTKLGSAGIGDSAVPVIIGLASAGDRDAEASDLY